MLSLVIIVLVLGIAPSIKESTDNAMNDTQFINYTNADGVTGQIEITGLNCSSSSISIYDKSTCVASDLVFNFYFLGTLIFLAGGIITYHIIFS
jgi:hypothetical protein